jgi:hypothetical protein
MIYFLIALSHPAIEVGLFKSYNGQNIVCQTQDIWHLVVAAPLCEATGHQQKYDPNSTLTD